jgi:hypothetical protein
MHGVENNSKRHPLDLFRVLGFKWPINICVYVIQKNVLFQYLSKKFEKAL